jgi:hypothetical protein
MHLLRQIQFFFLLSRGVREYGSAFFATTCASKQQCIFFPEKFLDGGTLRFLMAVSDK